MGGYDGHDSDDSGGGDADFMRGATAAAAEADKEWMNAPDGPEGGPELDDSGDEWNGDERYDAMGALDSLLLRPACHPPRRVAARAHRLRRRPRPPRHPRPRPPSCWSHWSSLPAPPHQEKRHTPKFEVFFYGVETIEDLRGLLRDSTLRAVPAMAHGFKVSQRAPRSADPRGRSRGAVL